MSEIDQQFKATAEQINAKLKEAAEAIQQAKLLAHSVGLTTGLIYTQWTEEKLQWHQKDNGQKKLSAEELEAKCDELQEKLELIDVSYLETALGGAGWSTSSSYC
jgi:hypothetical protein